MRKIEQWKTIQGYEGYYEVSNLGRIKSLERYTTTNHLIKEKILKTSIMKNGYEIVRLSKDGIKKTYLVHRLVAQAFISNPENKPHIDHIDTNRLNNKVENLKWVTLSENMNNPKTLEKFIGENNPMSKFTGGKNPASKSVYCIELDMTFETITEASKYVNVHRTAVSACVRGITKTAGKHPITGERLHWKYI